MPAPGAAGDVSARPPSTLSRGTRLLYGYVPHDPEAPTAASDRRGLGAREEVIQSHVARMEAPAHRLPVASQVPTARGRSFTYGAAGVLPSRATPAWRKGL